MSNTYPEQHPLLCDDLPEDDHYSTKYQRIHSISYRGRTKHRLRGAAAIFTRFPDHWTSFLTYWWIALGMIAITTLLVYNSLFAFAILPHDTANPLKRVSNAEYQIPESTRLPDVYMHVLKNYNDEIDLHQYLPYIELISNKFNRFKYHLIIVMNDTSIVGNGLAEMNNEIALNSLWSKEKAIKQKPLDNNMISTEYTVLSELMDNSPLKKHWRSLSNQLIEFLIRAISVWDKGGIAINPTILTPMSPHALYTEKLQNILRDYKRFNKKNIKDVKPKKKYSKKSSKKVKQKVNNIREIIDALNNNEIASNSVQQILAEAEDKEILTRMTRSEQKLFSNTEKYAANKSANQPAYDIQIRTKLPAHSNKNIDKQLERKRISIRDKSNDSTEIEQAQNSTSKSLLPLFLDFLFHNKPMIEQSQDKHESNGNNFTKINKTAAAITASKNKEKSNGNTSYSVTESLKDLPKRNDKYAPMIIATKYVHDKIENSSPVNMPTNTENSNRLTIDLKGNIIATETPCHAFIGTVFSNAVHHESSTITDFIITELSIFCKGLLSSCEGIDLILL